MQSSLNYLGFPVKLHFAKYLDNQRTAIRLIGEDGPIANVTVNMPEISLDENEVCIKDYSENVGMLQWLVENKIVEDTGKRIKSGYVEIPICRIIT